MPPTQDYVNPNAALQVPAVSSSSISSSTLTQQNPIPVLPPATINTGADTNLSIPTPQQIVDQTTKPSAAETQQSDLSKHLADMIGGEQSLATRQINAENAGGVPGYSKTLTELTNQLQGLNDQATKLQLDAGPGGAIENQNQLNALGRGVTAGGLAPIQTADLRRNQIQQAGIAAQSLTVKSAVYAAQGQYSMAKDAADKAAQVAFDADEQKIKGQQAQLAALQPTLDKEEKARALVQQAALNDRAQQIQNQREDFKSGQGLAITAMQNNPNDATAQYNAQQALKLDPKDPQYLQKVMSLVGQYQSDPLATQKAIDDHLVARAQLAKFQKETNALGAPAVTNPAAAPYAGVLSLILGSGKFTAPQTAQMTNAINNGEDPFTVIKNQAKNILGQTEATTVTKYETAQSSLQDIQKNLSDFYAKGGTTDLFSGNYEKVINKLGTQNNPALVDLATQIQASLQVYRNAVSGTAYSVQEGADISSIFPGINKSQGLNQSIIAGRMKAFDSTIDGTYRSALGPAYDKLKTLNTASVPSTPTADPNASLRSQLQPGEVLVIRNGQPYAVKPSEVNLKTDTFPDGGMDKL